MNFNYGMNFNLRQAKVEQKKPEEGIKGKEENNQTELPKSVVIAPKGKEITAKADELVENYIKGAIQIDRGASQSGKAFEVTSSVTKRPNLESLINLWNNENERMTNQKKFDLLTQIITALGDSDDVTIWRARRYAVGHNLAAEQMRDYLQQLKDGTAIYPDGIPVGYFNTDDLHACNNVMTGNVNYNEAMLVQLEGAIATNAYNSLLALVEFEGGASSSINFAKESAAYLFDFADGIADNPLNADKKWQPTFAEYKEQFKALQHYAEAVHEGNNVASTIHGISSNESNKINIVVQDLLSTVNTLREQGFQYCDQLLVSIQAYLAYAGHNDINVLQNPEE